MVKILLVVIGLALICLILRNYSRRLDRTPSSAASGSEDMVKCAQCGLNFPRGEALILEGRTFCCAEHGRQHRP